MENANMGPLAQKFNIKSSKRTLSFMGSPSERRVLLHCRGRPTRLRKVALSAPLP